MRPAESGRIRIACAARIDIFGIHFNALEPLSGPSSEQLARAQTTSQSIPTEKGSVLSFANLTS
jgi:hypothetical protein